MGEAMLQAAELVEVMGWRRLATTIRVLSNNSKPLFWLFVPIGLATIFWGMWYKIAGSVLATYSVVLTKYYTATFSLGVSRLWDILFAPLLLGEVAILLKLIRTFRGNLQDNPAAKAVPIPKFWVVSFFLVVTAGGILGSGILGKEGDFRQGFFLIALIMLWPLIAGVFRLFFRKESRERLREELRENHDASFKMGFLFLIPAFLVSFIISFGFVNGLAVGAIIILRSFWYFLIYLFFSLLLLFFLFLSKKLFKRLRSIIRTRNTRKQDKST